MKNYFKNSMKKATVLAIASACMIATLSGAPTRALADTTAASTEETANVADGRSVPHYDLTQLGGTWDGTHYYLSDGTLATQCFFTDGTYTYYLQNDGTPMKDRLTYHPDGTHVIYFDSNGHEVFSNFSGVKHSIAGDSVNDLCFFDTYGYMYVDKLTYDQAGVNLYYVNPYGVIERNGWFKFSDGGTGYANADGTLMVNTNTYDQSGNLIYIQGDGHVQGTGTSTPSAASTTPSASTSDLASQIAKTEYTYEDSIGDTYHFFILKNNSSKTVDVTTDGTALDASGKALDSDSGYVHALSSGCETILYELYDVSGVASYKENIKVEETDTNYFTPVIQNIAFSASKNGSDVTAQATNNGQIAAGHVMAYALYFKNGKVVDYNFAYLTDSSSSLPVGATIAKNVKSYDKTYDDVKVYYTAYNFN